MKFSLGQKVKVIQDDHYNKGKTGTITRVHNANYWKYDVMCDGAGDVHGEDQLEAIEEQLQLFT